MIEMKHTQAETTAYAGAVTATVNGCRMYLASCTCNDLPADEQEANARLLAAAPDLLAVAQMVLAASVSGPVAELAKSAIRKATRVPA